MKMRKGRTSSLRRASFHLLTEYLSLRDFLRLSLPLVFTRRMAFIAHSLCGGGMENKHKVMNLRNRLVQQVSGCIRREEGGKERSGWSQPLQEFRNLGDKRKSICER